MTDIKKLCDKATELIESCWDCNQKLDENGKPVDGLTFDERLDKKRNYPEIGRASCRERV